MVAPSFERQASQSSFSKCALDATNKEEAWQVPSVIKAHKVQFSLSNNQVFEIPHINDMSDTEIDAIWMNCDDFRAIRRECKLIISMMVQGDDRQRGVELRGLEHHMPKKIKEIESIQCLLYDTVERLMQFTDDTSVDVTDLLGDMCSQISSKPKESARQIALQDERDVESRKNLLPSLMYSE